MRQPDIGFPVTRIRVDWSVREPIPADLHRHLDWLIGIGMSRAMIARAAGTTTGTVNRIVNGTQQLCTREVRDALRSVTPRPNKHQAYVLSYAAKRRLEGLAVMGWTTQKLAHEMGMGRHTGRIDAVRRGGPIAWETHVTVADCYDRLSVVDGGNERTKRWAAQHEFVHPMDWVDIDDFDESPSGPPTMTLDEYRATEVAFFESIGYSEAEVAAALGIKLDTLQVWKRRMQVVAA